MLSPTPPRDETRAERERYERDLADKRQTPRRWGSYTVAPQPDAEQSEGAEPKARQRGPGRPPKASA